MIILYSAELLDSIKKCEAFLKLLGVTNQDNIRLKWVANNQGDSYMYLILNDVGLLSENERYDLEVPILIRECDVDANVDVYVDYQYFKALIQSQFISAKKGIDIVILEYYPELGSIVLQNQIGGIFEIKVNEETIEPSHDFLDYNAYIKSTEPNFSLNSHQVLDIFNLLYAHKENKETYRPAMCNYYIKVVDKQAVEAVTTDGYSLGILKLNGAHYPLTPPFDPEGYILPPVFIDLAQKLKTGMSVFAHREPGENSKYYDSVIAVNNSYILSTQTRVLREFPTYDAIVPPPETKPYHWTIALEALGNILQVIKAFKNKERANYSRQLKLTFNESTELEITALSDGWIRPQGDDEAELKWNFKQGMEFNCPGFTIGILLTQLETLYNEFSKIDKTGIIQIYFDESNQKSIIAALDGYENYLEADFMDLFMPVRL
ncbi:MAG TPA: hypothetical protein PKV40_01590 [Candidatus Kapabacteria bacterium]|nr:hypothetical protein [Candidatus Kapabacteria bacterium]